MSVRVTEVLPYRAWVERRIIVCSKNKRIVCSKNKKCAVKTKRKHP